MFCLRGLRVEGTGFTHFLSGGVVRAQERTSPTIGARIEKSLADRVDELTSVYGHTLPGEVVRVRLVTGPTADDILSPRNQLGLQLVGRLAAETNSGGEDATLGVFVVGILPGSVAANDGSIRVGDQLLEV